MLRIIRYLIPALVLFALTGASQASAAGGSGLGSGPGSSPLGPALVAPDHDTGPGSSGAGSGGAGVGMPPPGPSSPTQPTVPGFTAKIKHGVAYAPSDAPIQVQKAIWAGDQIRLKPYVYGGGHGVWKDFGYDCSGSVSYVLHAAGLLKTSMDSSEFESWGQSGHRSVDHRVHQPRPCIRPDRRDPVRHLGRGRSPSGAGQRPALAAPDARRTAAFRRATRRACSRTRSHTRGGPARLCCARGSRRVVLMRRGLARLGVVFPARVPDPGASADTPMTTPPADGPEPEEGAQIEPPGPACAGEPPPMPEGAGEPAPPSPEPVASARAPIV